MRAKITIIFETHGQGTVEQDNDWLSELSDLLEEKSELKWQPNKYPLGTFDVVAVEKLTEEPE